MLRAAVVGLGNMGRNHARVWRENIDGVQLVGVAEPSPTLLDAVTADLGVTGYRDVGSLLAKEKPDLVSIAVPTSLHEETVLESLGQGCHVLVEKPIAANREEAERMIAAAEGAGRLLTVGHIERFNPAIIELRRRLADREIGRIFQVTATRLGPFPERIRDVGVVVDLAPHDLDIMRFLLGVDPVRIYAETERRIHTDHEDLFVGVLKFPDGAVGLLSINWLTPTKRRTLTVTGERGSYAVDYLTQELVFHPNRADGSVSEGEAEYAAIETREPLRVELEAFATAVRTGGPPPVEPIEALRALQLARALVEAANTGAALAGSALERWLA